MRLYRHDGDFMVRVRGLELMSSRETGSEEMLAEFALARLADTTRARVMVGGLGMGFTLARVLGLIGVDAVAEVVELVPEIVEWNRRWLGELNGHPLRDERVVVVEGDVRDRIRSSKAAYDVILLDVDNGPEGLVRKSNDQLYSKEGLKAAAAALRPGGILAVWSISDEPWFTDRIRSTGFEVTEERVRARRRKGPKRTIWLATPRAR
jgi:spermidine synthase